MKTPTTRPWLASRILPLLVVCTGFLSLACSAESAPGSAQSIYDQLKSFSLGYRTLQVQRVALKRDRGLLTFESGTFYFSPPVAGKVRSAVFIGEGTFHADAPPSSFERDNVRRLLKVDSVESDFKTAVLRFTDDTFSELGANSQPDAHASDQARKLASELDERVLEECGANLSSRQLISILNHESPGFFFVQVDGGKRGRFNFLLDYQARIPVANFGINAGERGLIFHPDLLSGSDVWMAFYKQEDYQQGSARYSDEDDLILAQKYNLQIDVTEPKKWLRLTARIECAAKTEDLIAIPFEVGEGLSHFDNQRKKKQLCILSATVGDNSPVAFFQEPWEGGFTVVLPDPRRKGEAFTLKLALEGEFMKEASVQETYFPIETTAWYPRHGYLQHSLFDLEFRREK